MQASRQLELLDSLSKRDNGGVLQELWDTINKQSEQLNALIKNNDEMTALQELKAQTGQLSEQLLKLSSLTPQSPTAISPPNLCPNASSHSIYPTNLFLIHIQENI